MHSKVYSELGRVDHSFLEVLCPATGSRDPEIRLQSEIPRFREPVAERRRVDDTERRRINYVAIGWIEKITHYLQWRVLAVAASGGGSMARVVGLKKPWGRGSATAGISKKVVLFRRVPAI